MWEFNQVRLNGILRHIETPCASLGMGGWEGTETSSISQTIHAWNPSMEYLHTLGRFSLVNVGTLPQTNMELEN